LTGLFGPHGPSSVETQGLLTSITFPEQAERAKNSIKKKLGFFMNFVGNKIIFKKLDA
jgi:hypothetical protein